MNKKQYAAATQRNREPILTVLKEVLPPTGIILEIASGTGEHAVFLAPRLQPRKWLPSETNPLLRESIEAWSQEYPSDNLLPVKDINAEAANWGLETEKDRDITAIVNINMIHISPWSACVGLMAGAERLLPSQGILYLYGPYKIEGKHTSESNVSFDEMLQAQNPTWGVRDLNAVVQVAAEHQLVLQSTVPMPANNFSVIFQKK